MSGGQGGFYGNCLHCACSTSQGKQGSNFPMRADSCLCIERAGPRQSSAHSGPAAGSRPQVEEAFIEAGPV